MTAQDILKLIETVSPDDTATLDEIDARVWCWLDNEQYWSNTDTEVTLWRAYDEDDILWYEIYPKYTRSRDALKAIRPKGFYFQLRSLIGDTFQATLVDKTKIFVSEAHLLSSELPTEELAELHAIIQAIEYERNGK